MEALGNQDPMFSEYITGPLLQSVFCHEQQNAFCINDKFFTYKDLFRVISGIRAELKAKVVKGKNVGVIANDDLETYASIIAIWLEGGAYVPLHPLQPADRNLDIIGQAEISLVLDSGINELLPGIPSIKSRGLRSDTPDLEPAECSDESLAYILFTSGSTGKPKGVPITRGNLGWFMKSFWEAGFIIDHHDRCLQCFDLTFDVSVQSFLVPLTRGACTYTIPHDQIKYSYVYGLLEDHQLTFGAMAPSMLRYMRPYFDEINAPAMRYSILTAEASPVDLLEEWSRCIPNAEIFDFYGPTEATIYCTYYKFNRNRPNKHLNGMLSIGKPMAGISAIIMDDEGKIAAPNQKGELCISGNQLTPGYWHNPDKTSNAFFRLQQQEGPVRLYKTGDLCFIDEDGDIMYSGRLDYQVKIQGYRIELGEIEYHARWFLKDLNAVALPYTNAAGTNEIALFIEGSRREPGDILNHLKLKLPSYMIPSKILFRESFQLNNNGKIDRVKLKESLYND